MNSCSTYNLRDTSETSKLTMFEHMNAERKLADFIAESAACTVEDPKIGRRIWLEARLYFARRMFSTLERHLRGGGNLTEMLPLIWRWRRDLGCVGAANLLKCARPVAIVLFPKPITDTIRFFKRIGRNVLMDKTSA